MRWTARPVRAGSSAPAPGTAATSSGCCATAPTPTGCRRSSSSCIRDRRSGRGTRGRGRPDRRRGPNRGRGPERRVRGRGPGADRAAGRHLGNISDEDLWRLVGFSPQLCAPGATLLWSRGHRRVGPQRPDPDPAGRRGFAELDYATSGGENAAALGVVRYDGPPVALAARPAAVHVPCAEGGQEPVAEGVHPPDRCLRPGPHPRRPGPRLRPGRGPPGHRRRW